MSNTSRTMDAKKHFTDKRITKRCPDTRNILSTDELLYWFSKYSYQFDCKKFTVIGYNEKTDKPVKNTFKTLEDLAVFLKASVALKRTSSAGKKGELPIDIVRALYHSNKKNDPKKDVELILHGCEEYLSDKDKRKK